MTRTSSVPVRVSTLALAIALAAGPSPAAAQSFQGTGSVANGSASIAEGTGTTTVTVNTAQTVIDWDADDDAVGNFGAINFQPQGTTATFQNNVDLVGDFAVLNRINIADPTRIVALNGTIQSLVNGQTGGSIFFYSPSGFVLTGTSVINVGSLVLSASPITVDGNGNFINGGTVIFGQAPNPNAQIITVSDVTGTAQISSSGAGSYVALVAPTILHQGDIRTDGTAALVAAEAATINFDPFGLFDIQVTVGTDAAQGIHVDGGTIGRNSATVAAGNIHRAYLVAVAKNDAVTMTISNGASVGFEIGTSATVEDNAVVISGGYDVDNGDQDLRSGVSQIDLLINNSSLSSHVDAQVTGGALINSGAGALSFGGDLSIIGGENSTAGGNVLIDGMNGNTLTIAGNLYARSFRRNSDGSQSGLITRLGSTGGSLVTVGGDVTLDSDSFGAQVGNFQETGTSATGGNAQVNISTNSQLDVGGSITVHADGYGGSSSGNGVAGDGTGGQALVMSIGGNATVTVGGSVTAHAIGYGGGVGGDCTGQCGVTGGTGRGGFASVHTNLGSGNLMQIAGDVSVSAAGQGGGGDVQAGSGIGGTARLGASDTSTLTVGADSEADASGRGGYGYNNIGGLGRGGIASIGTDTGGTINLSGPAFVTSNGEGGSAETAGGIGTGGRAFIAAVRGTIHAFGDMLVSADSVGGAALGAGGTGGAGLADIEQAVTPEMTEASLFAMGGTLIVDGLTIVSAGATGGNGGFNGGDGGNAVAAGVPGVINGGAIIHAGNSDAGASVIQLGAVTVSAEASGGAGGDGQGGVNGSDGGEGGSATGGRAIITAAAGSGDLTAGATIISASAVGGAGGSGGGGDGGTGGNGGNGGNATGGLINVGTESGNVNLAQGSNNGVATYTSILAFTNATGGNGGNAGFGSPAGVAGDGGDAVGGTTTLLVRGSIVNVGNVNLVANANGGNGGLDPTENPQGSGGIAITGAVGVLATNRFQLPDQRGTLNAGAITGNALATGGTGGINGGAFTRGGGAFFEFVNSEGTIDSVNLIVGADGIDPNATETFASSIAIVEGVVDIAGGFNLQTPGRVSIHVDNPEPVSSLTAATFSVSADNFVHDETRPLPADIGTISADTITLGTAGDLIVDAHLISTASLTLTAPGLVDIEDASSGGDIVGGAGTSFTAGTLTAAGSVSVSAPGAINLNLVNAGTDISILSFLETINSTGMSSANGSIFLDGLGGISTGPLTAAGDVTASSESDISLGDVGAGGFIDIFSSSGSLSLSDLSATTTIHLDATGNILFADVTADDFDFDSGGTVTGGDIVAGTMAGGEAEGAVSLGNISVGIQLEGGPSEDGFAVGIASATSISVLDVEADEAIGFATLGTLTTGDLDAGTNVLAMVGGDMSLGAVSTAPDGRTYLADVQMFINAGGPDDFIPGDVFNAEPLATGGSIAIGGPVSTGRFQAAAGTALTTGAIDADSIEASAGGLASINGLWTAPFVELFSNDIAIGASGGIDGGPGGLIRLVSTNATQMLIGDGLGGTGYALSNAEFGRLSAGNVEILGRGDASAAIDMLIGDLDVTGPTAGSTLEDPLGTLLFATGDADTETAGGVIRVTGELRATGFSEDNEIEFVTGRFELDAATGLIDITSDGTALSGILSIDADRVHVASGDILDQLAIDPQYAGYQDDLNDPAAVQRPDGVVRAGSIEVLSNGPLAVLVQNTGTAQTPAGFLTFAEGPFFNDGEPPTGPIELIINGQLITEQGTLTGVEVRDFLIDETNVGFFTDNSTINGCELTGPCGFFFGDNPQFTPTPGIQEIITLIDEGQLPPPMFGNEEFIDDNDEATEDGATSPIEPPVPLFDTSQLGAKGDVDDPVSGSGNPALMETPPPPSTPKEKQP